MGRVFAFEVEIHNDNLVELGFSSLFNEDSDMDRIISAMSQNYDTRSEIRRAVLDTALTLEYDGRRDKEDYIEALCEAVFQLGAQNEEHLTVNEVNWCFRETEDAQVGYLGYGDDLVDSDYAGELRAEGFTMTFDAAREILETRLKNTIQYIKMRSETL